MGWYWRMSSLAPGPLLGGRLLARGSHIALVAVTRAAAALGLEATPLALAAVLLATDACTPLCHSAHPLSKKSHGAFTHVDGASVERML